MTTCYNSGCAIHTVASSHACATRRYDSAEMPIGSAMKALKRVDFTGKSLACASHSSKRIVSRSRRQQRSSWSKEIRRGFDLSDLSHLARDFCSVCPRFQAAVSAASCPQHVLDHRVTTSWRILRSRWDTTSQGRSGAAAICYSTLDSACAATI